MIIHESVNADNNLAIRTLICQRRQIIWQLTPLAKLFVQSQQSDLNRRPSDYKTEGQTLQPWLLLTFKSIKNFMS
ncbi:hypothetical protein [Scytonema hofmannii]|uniref:hypothetical protein n=1 Tax=Scytonema hofmannii TaxID=34078 RepID=UPI0011E061B2|nr:hypothetical protein [Scytonema hofmannii]